MRLASELFHWAALLPLAACAVGWWRQRDPGAFAWLLAVAVGLSAVADSLSAMVAAQGQPNAWVGYLVGPLQLGLVVALVAPSVAIRWVLWVGLASLAVASALRGPLDRQETVIEVVGGLLVGWLAVGPFASSIRLFWGWTIPATVGLVAAVPGSSVWWGCWWVYQGVRMVGIGACTWEVARGFRRDGIAGLTGRAGLSRGAAATVAPSDAGGPVPGQSLSRSGSTAPRPAYLGTGDGVTRQRPRPGQTPVLRLTKEPYGRG